jgi:hypothetical protein
MSDCVSCHSAGVGSCYYVAIGSMMNPVSLSLRGLNPIESWPCRCVGFTRRFWGKNGMAEIFEDDDGEFHGVLHKMSDDDLKKLDTIEQGYIRKDVTCVLYDGTQIVATGYQFDRNKITVDEARPPSERYVEIMCLGMEHFGCDSAAIAALRATPDIIPRKNVLEYRSLPFKAGCENCVFTRAEVQQNDGREGRPLHKVVNRKVIQFREPEGVSAEAIAARFAQDQEKGAGQDLTPFIARMLYEPKYPVCSDAAQMGPEHRAFVEDLMVDFIHNPPVYYECVGSLKEE